MTEPVCTCPETDPVRRSTAYTVRQIGLEPHAVGCPRHGMGTPLKLREGDQQLPVPNGARDVQSQVIEDIEARRQVGISRYGTALQPHNGRDALRDLYEELIDACCYIKQVILERDLAEEHRASASAAAHEASEGQYGAGSEDRCPS